MKTLLVGVAIAALVLANAHDIAGAGQVGSVVKPNIRTPRIIVRPRIVTPKTNRLIKKNTVEEVTNPAATQGGSAAEAVSPVQSRTPPRLRNQIRVVAAIPRPRPANIMDYMNSIEAKNPHGNIMELVFLVMRDALREMNEDKSYWLNKLADLNKIGDALHEQLEEVADASRKLAERDKDGEEGEKKQRGESIVKEDDDRLQQSIGMASDTEPCLSRNC